MQIPFAARASANSPSAETRRRGQTGIVLGLAFALSGCNAILGIEQAEVRQVENAPIEGEDAAINAGEDAAFDATGPLAGDAEVDGGPAQSCQPADTRCSAEATNTLETCNEQGRWLSEACSGQACVAGKCVGECSPQSGECTSPVARRSCLQDGTWGAAQDCVDSACVNGSCQGVCRPGATSCADSGAQRTCRIDGTWGDPEACGGSSCVDNKCTGGCNLGMKRCDPTSFTGIQQCSQSNEWVAAGSCATGVCTGEGICMGDCVPGSAPQCQPGSAVNVQTCQPGGKWQTTSSCTAGACVNGRCMGSCTPNNVRCTPGSLTSFQTCMPNGEWSTTPTACTNQACVGGACSGQCSPGTQECVDNRTRRVCSDLGVWTESACTGQACSNGSCRGTCSPGTTSCDPANQLAVRTCDNNGDWKVTSTCSMGVCSNGSCTGDCRPGIDVRCQPGSFINRQTCGAGGTWNTPTACTNQACENGSCVGVCTPGATMCANNTQRRVCGNNGQWGTPTTCTGQACANNTCTGVCVPGTVDCTTSTKYNLCSNSGTWQTDNTCVNQACYNDSCTGVCTPGAVRCNATTKNADRCELDGQWVERFVCQVPGDICRNGACVLNEKRDWGNKDAKKETNGWNTAFDPLIDDVARMYALRITAPPNAVYLTAFRLIGWQDGGSCKMGLYDDLNNRPNRRLATSDPIAVTATLPNGGAPFPTTTILNANATYWVAAVCASSTSGTPRLIQKGLAGQRFFVLPQSYISPLVGTFPTTGASSTSDVALSLFIEVMDVP